MMLQDFLNWVDSFLNFEKLPQKNIFWLDMMQLLCNEFENPQNDVPCFHVAGSKGKGSVCAMIASILSEDEKKIGVYASPHISDFRERIRLNDRFFSDEVYQSAAQILKEKFEKIKDKLPKERAVTWFELVTVYAFLVMKNAGVDVAVYEVGLGGRLDATNIVNPLISVINTIELEHTEFLGDTVEKIAAEKAGIIKEGVPVLCAAQTENVKKVFIEKAKEKNSKIYFADELIEKTDFSYDIEKKMMNVFINSNLFSRPLKFSTHMLGEYQAKNAALAAAAVKLVYPDFDEGKIEEGLSKVSLPARFEIVHNPSRYPKLSDLVIDGAHTVKSVSLTMDTLLKFYGDKKLHLLFACAADKDVVHIAELFKNKFESVTLTKPGLTKSCNKDKMCSAFSTAGIDAKFYEDYKAGIEAALKNAEDKKAVLLVTGSFYLASEVTALLY